MTIAVTLASVSAPLRRCHHGAGIAHPKLHPQLGQLVSWQCPGEMDLGAPHSSQLLHPQPHKLPVLVIVQTLLDHVELSVLPRIVADARRIVPVAIVGAHVVVQQLGLEPLRAQSPVQTQVLDEEAGHVLPSSVGHPARPGQLPHVGINKGHPSPSLTPGLELGLVLGPGNLLVLDS